MRTMRLAMVLALSLALVACGREHTRSTPRHAPPSSSSPASRGTPSSPHGEIRYGRPPRVIPPSGPAPDGGPAIPPDVSDVPEAVPRPERLAAYGNKSPYTVLGHTYRVMSTSRGYVQRGTASWYGTKFHGRLTSSREPYDMYQMTAAHKTLPLPTFVRVTNLDNGRSLVVRVNDRGPFHEDRIIDLSYAAALRLGIHIKGTGRVEVRALEPAATRDGVASAPRPIGPIAAPPATSPSTPRVAPSAPPSPALARDTPVIVQVGAFAERDNAKRLADRLRDAGIDRVDLDRARSNGRTVHRVKIGPVKADRVDALRERLRRLGVHSISIATD